MLTSLVRNLNSHYRFCVSIKITGFSQLQLEIIRASLPHVHKFGWTDNAIQSACLEMNLSPAAHRIIKPYHMIDYCMQDWNMKALRIVDDSNFDGKLKIKEKVWQAIKQRLNLEIGYIDSWNQAMGIGAHPSNIARTKDLLWQYSDQIWRRCGDKSTDYNYYTKRILFNTAYASTELHLLTDQSFEKTETWNFLQRRIDDILQLGKGVNDIKTVAGAAFDGILNLTSMFKQPPARQIKSPIFESKFKSFQSEPIQSLQKDNKVKRQ